MSKPKPVPIDYVSQLSERITDLRGRVAAGKSPLPERISELDEAVTEYAVMQAKQYEDERAKAVETGRSPNTVPPALRNHALLDRAADLLMYEYLTWSHPDKMSIVEDPILSGWQEEERSRRFVSIQRLNSKSLNFNVDSTSEWVNRISVKGVLDRVKLTERQRQAVTLVILEDLPQVEVASRMGVRRPAANEHLSIGLRKIKEAWASDEEERVYEA